MTGTEPDASRGVRISAPTAAAILLAVVPTLLYLGGIPLHDGTPGTCDAWPGCSPSAREQWGWTARPWAGAGIAVATFLVVARRVSPWLHERPALVRRTSVVVLVLAALVTAAFALLALVVWGTDCSDAGWICFGGPEDALVLGSPGLVGGVVTVLVASGLARARRGDGRLAVWTVGALAAALVASAVSTAASGVLALVGPG